MHKVANKKKSEENLVEKYSLDNIDQLLLKHLAKFPQTTVSELARLIKYSTTGTQKRLQKPAFKKALTELQECTNDTLNRIANKALRKLEKFVDADDEKTSIKACHIVLEHYFNQKKLVTDSGFERIIFTTQIGDDGAVRREVLEVPKKISN